MYISKNETMNQFGRKYLVHLQCHGLVHGCSFSIQLTQSKKRDTGGELQ